mmetsp:Transcript_37159/g.48871  ORF Transcript_37159/g.48871 Transcript_37159/m.48871 type:complete len:268 (-) Transcript_37159:512-1315(-)
MDRDPVLARQERSHPCSLEEGSNLLDNHLNLHFDLFGLRAGHLLENLLKNLSVVLSGVFGCAALLPKKLQDLLNSRHKSEILGEVVTLNLRHVVLTLRLVGFLFWLPITVLLISVSSGSRLLLLAQLLHKLGQVSGQGLLFDPLPAALSSRHLLTSLPQEGILLLELGRDLGRVSSEDLFIILLLVFFLITVLLLIVLFIVVLLVAALFLLLLGGLGSSALFGGGCLVILLIIVVVFFDLGLLLLLFLFFLFFFLLFRLALLGLFLF